MPKRLRCKLRHSTVFHDLRKRGLDVLNSIAKQGPQKLSRVLSAFIFCRQQAQGGGILLNLCKGDVPQRNLQGILKGQSLDGRRLDASRHQNRRQFCCRLASPTERTWVQGLQARASHESARAEQEEIGQNTICEA